ncbi:MAG: hypothetical protein ACPG5V_14980, partial [Vibrio cyclitrophicus]
LHPATSATDTANVVKAKRICISLVCTLLVLMPASFRAWFSSSDVIYNWILDMYLQRKCLLLLSKNQSNVK